MNVEEIKILSIIAISLVTGGMLGASLIILCVKYNTNLLEKEVETLHRKLNDCLKAYHKVVNCDDDSDYNVY